MKKTKHLIKILFVLLSISIPTLSHSQNKVTATIILDNQQKVDLSILYLRYDKKGMKLDDLDILLLKDDNDNWMQIPLKSISQIIPIKSGTNVLKYKVVMKSGNIKEGYDGRGYKWVCGPDADEIFVMHKLSEVNKIIIGKSVY